MYCGVTASPYSNDPLALTSSVQKLMRCLCQYQLPFVSVHRPVVTTTGAFSIVWIKPSLQNHKSVSVYWLLMSSV